MTLAPFTFNPFSFPKKRKEKKKVRNTSDHHCSTHFASDEHEEGRVLETEMYNVAPLPMKCYLKMDLD